jgi:hypothetical protein
MAHGKRAQALMDPAERLAQARGETVDSVRRRFSKEEIARCPRRFNRHVAAVRDAKLARTGVRDGLAFVELENGRDILVVIGRNTDT